MGDGVVIRQCGDAATLAGLRRAWVEENAGEPIDDADFEIRYAEWAEAEHGRRDSFLARAGGVPVGMMNLTWFERMPAPGRAGSRWCYLGNAFVLASHRNLGIGTALLSAVLEHARTRGAVRVVLSPSPRSVAFYQRAGFGAPSMLMAQEIA